MSGIERKFQKQVDKLIFEASPEELKAIQELDINTQLSGSSFYEQYSNYMPTKKKLESKPNTFSKNKK